MTTTVAVGSRDVIIAEESFNKGGRLRNTSITFPSSKNLPNQRKESFFDKNEQWPLQVAT